MKTVLIGYGEVGRGLYAVFDQHHLVAIHDKATLRKADPGEYDLMLVAIPYSDEFVNIVLRYVSEDFKCRAIVVFSTVPIGTCRKIGAVHSPIEGRHDNMADSIKMHTRWIGGGTFAQRKLFTDFCLEAGIRGVHRVNSSDVTEFLKLQSLAIYGINIEWARYCRNILESMGEGFEKVEDYNDDYNDLVRWTKQPRYRRYNLLPPEGVIGGHCVLQNMKYLKHPFIEYVIDANRGIEQCRKMMEPVQGLSGEKSD